MTQTLVRILALQDRTFRAPSASTSSIASSSSIPKNFSFKKIGQISSKAVAAKTHGQRKQAAKLAASSSRGKLRRAESATSKAMTLSFTPMTTGWVFVGNLPPAATARALKRFFSEVAGPVKDVTIRYSGAGDKAGTAATPKYRYAVVVFDGDAEESANSANRAVLQDGAIITGDERFHGFRLVVTDQPAGLPDVNLVAKSAGISDRQEMTLFAGLPRHNPKLVPGAETAAGHVVGNEGPANGKTVNKTQVWDPRSLANLVQREASRLDRRKEKKDQKWRQLTKLEEGDENSVHMVKFPVGDKGKGKAAPQNTMFVGGQRFTLTPVL
ncbi:RRM domain-containing protein [Mycena indigotica]|uniref:RRM domain-containing protein n=1 Tax=Mycena indigotica TaxID=2126181 RepID=A0A8H6SNM1_9AGAR|nr:RRM domain-containing protein [Mycena indigotica]KAF7302107.1 RRM domain-containing protein [Mycena indigotica]